MSDFQLNRTITDPQLLMQTFFREYPDYAGKDKDFIQSGWKFLCAQAGDKQRPGGEPYILHPMRVACILAENKLDGECIVAGFLHNILKFEDVDPEKIERQFGPAVINIIRCSQRITGLNMKSKTLEQADSFRKMLFAMTDDIRVILVKMADRLDRIRSISFLESEEQKNISSEIIEIWAPLANRLGMAAVKIEMEDLSLKFSNPDVFAQLKKIVSKKRKKKFIKPRLKRALKFPCTAEQNIFIRFIKKCAKKTVPPKSFWICSPYEFYAKRPPTVTSWSGSCITCGSRSKEDLKIISRCPRQTATGAYTRPFCAAPVLWKFKYGRTKCMRSPNTESQATGCTKKA